MNKMQLAYVRIKPRGKSGSRDPLDESYIILYRIRGRERKRTEPELIF
jgi:hypothetical protein